MWWRVGIHEAAFDLGFPIDEPESSSRRSRTSLSGVVEDGARLLVDSWRSSFGDRCVPFTVGGVVVVKVSRRLGIECVIVGVRMV